MSTIEKAAAQLVKKPRVEAADPENSNAEVVDGGADTLQGVSPVNTIVNKGDTIGAGTLSRPTDPETLTESAQDTADTDGLGAIGEGDHHGTTKPAGFVTSDTEYAYDHDSYVRRCELDFAHLAENGFLVPNHASPKTNQEMRCVKRPLLLNTHPNVASQYPKPTNVIFFTSAVSGEGKTFVATNLALSLAAELDRSVLLMDGDASKRDLSRWMGIEGEEGLVDLLRNGNGYGESAIIETNMERLSVMSSGGYVKNLDELFASDLMTTLLFGMARRDPSRIIVVDGPPLLATTEAAVLAHLAGQVVFVVEAGNTPQHHVVDAATQLQDCQLVNTLLNKSRETAEASYGYGYGYGNKNKQGYQSEKESDALSSASAV